MEKVSEYVNRPVVGVTSNRHIDDGVHRDRLRRRYIERSISTLLLNASFFLLWTAIFVGTQASANSVI